MLPAHLPGQNVPEVNELVEVETMPAERVKEWTKEWEEAGMQKGGSQLLTCLIETKFGLLSQNFIARMEQADDEQILLWSERILTAEKLSDIFGN